MQVFFGKNIEKKHLCRHDKNYYYFCKSEIPVINLIAQVLEYDQSFKKLNKQREPFSPNTDNCLAFFIAFEWGRILKSVMDKKEVKCNAKLRSNCFCVKIFVLAIVFRR